MPPHTTLEAFAERHCGIVVACHRSAKKGAGRRERRLDFSMVPFPFMCGLILVPEWANRKPKAVAQIIDNVLMTWSSRRAAQTVKFKITDDLKVRIYK